MLNKKFVKKILKFTFLSDNNARKLFILENTKIQQ